MDLILIRHALPERADGDRATADPPLAPLGHRQAAATAEFLAGERIDGSSPAPCSARARPSSRWHSA